MASSSEERAKKILETQNELEMMKYTIEILKQKKIEKEEEERRQRREMIERNEKEMEILRLKLEIEKEKNAEDEEKRKLKEEEERRQRREMIERNAKEIEILRLKLELEQEKKAEEEERKKEKEERKRKEEEERKRKEEEERKQKAEQERIEKEKRKAALEQEVEEVKEKLLEAKIEKEKEEIKAKLKKEKMKQTMDELMELKRALQLKKDIEAMKKEKQKENIENKKYAMLVELRKLEKQRELRRLEKEEELAKLQDNVAAEKIRLLMEAHKNELKKLNDLQRRHSMITAQSRAEAIVLDTTPPNWTSLGKEEKVKFFQFTSKWNGSEIVVSIASESTCKIKMRTTPFAKGGLRWAYYMYSPTRRENLVAKQFFWNEERDLAWSSWMDTVKYQELSIYLANQYNSEKLPHMAEIKETPIFLIEFIERSPPVLMGAELFLDGKFEKFNSNSGYVEPGHTDIQALSHFSFQHTRGKYLLVDLQGIKTNSNQYLLTDPAFHSKLSNCGETDLGYRGIESFFKTHECSESCRALKLIKTEGGIVPSY